MKSQTCLKIHNIFKFLSNQDFLVQNHCIYGDLVHKQVTGIKYIISYPKEKYQRNCALLNIPLTSCSRENTTDGMGI